MDVKKLISKINQAQTAQEEKEILEQESYLIEELLRNVDALGKQDIVMLMKEVLYINMLGYNCATPVSGILKQVTIGSRLMFAIYTTIPYCEVHLLGCGTMMRMIHSPDPRAVKDALQALSHVIHEEVLFNAFFSYLIGMLEAGQFNDNFVRTVRCVGKGMKGNVTEQQVKEVKKILVVLNKALESRSWTRRQCLALIHSTCVLLLNLPENYKYLVLSYNIIQNITARLPVWCANKFNYNLAFCSFFQLLEHYNMPSVISDALPKLKSCFAQDMTGLDQEGGFATHLEYAKFMHTHDPSFRVDLLAHLQSKNLCVLTRTLQFMINNRKDEYSIYIDNLVDLLFFSDELVRSFSAVLINGLSGALNTHEIVKQIIFKAKLKQTPVKNEEILAYLFVIVNASCLNPQTKFDELLTIANHFNEAVFFDMSKYFISYHSASIKSNMIFSIFSKLHKNIQDRTELFLQVCLLCLYLCPDAVVPDLARYKNLFTSLIERSLQGESRSQVLCLISMLKIVQLAPDFTDLLIKQHAAKYQSIPLSSIRETELRELFKTAAIPLELPAPVSPCLPTKFFNIQNLQQNLLEPLNFESKLLEGLDFEALIEAAEREAQKPSTTEPLDLSDPKNVPKISFLEQLPNMEIYRSMYIVIESRTNNRIDNWTLYVAGKRHVAVFIYPPQIIDIGMVHKVIYINPESTKTAFRVKIDYNVQGISHSHTAEVVEMDEKD